MPGHRFDRSVADHYTTTCERIAFIVQGETEVIAMHLRTPSRHLGLMTDLYHQPYPVRYSDGLRALREYAVYLVGERIP